LKADVIVISDTGIINNETPSITVGLRGLSYLEVEVTGPNRDLHSGMYGGAVDNPINVLCQMIAKLKDDKGRITIPGFYDKVLELNAAEREQMARAPFDLEAYKKELEIDDVFYEARGATWALIQFLSAVEVDFADVLAKKNATASLQQIIRELETTQETVWSPMILNGGGFGFVANHSLVMASYISRANAAIIDLRELLSQG